jgi:hypothetical protein
MGVLDRLDVTATYLVDLYWLDSSGEWYQLLYLSSCGSKVRLDTLHQAKVVAVSDLVHDNNGPSRCAITLMFAGPYQVWSNQLATWIDQVYETWADLSADYPKLRAGAFAWVRLEVTDVNGTSEVKAQILGKVRCPSHCDGLTVTLEVEQTSSTSLTLIPASTLSRLTVPANDKDNIDRDNGGAVFPVQLGDCIPGMVTPLSTEWFRYKLGVLGLEVPTQPTIRSNRHYESANNRWVEVFPWTEKSSLAVLSGDYYSAYLESAGGKALVFRNWTGTDGVDRTAALTYDGIFKTTSVYSGVANVLTSSSRPWVMMPSVPVPVDDPYGNAAKACDGNTLTYCTILPGQTVDWELKSINLDGTLSWNSTDVGTSNLGFVDYEGAGRPVGIKICALLVMPPGGTAPGAGTVALNMVNAAGATALAGALASTHTPPSSGYVLCQNNQPCSVSGYIVGNRGWRGTRLAEGRFTNSIDSGANPDYPLYSGVLTKEEPLRIRITNNNANPVYVMAVAVVLGCRLNTKATDERYLRKVFDAAGYARARGPNAGADAVRIGGETRETARYAPRITQLSGCSVARPSYVDDDAGTYTGVVGDNLTEPLEFARLLLNDYAGETTAYITEGNAFGSYDWARALLRIWYKGASGNQKWSMLFNLTSQQTTEQAIEALCADCMDLRVRRLPSGKYTFCHWYPASLCNPYQYYGGSSAYKIDVDRHVLSRDGMPQIDVSEADSSTVCNNIEITYGAGGNHVATCSAAGSDDGTGVQWGFGGLMPGESALTPVELCVASVARYGEQLTRKLTLPHVETPVVATMVGMFHLARDSRAARFLRFASTAFLHDLYPGMYFKLNNDLADRYGFKPPYWPAGTTWPQLTWMCTANEQRSDGGAITQAITAVFIPEIVGEDWNPTGIAGDMSGLDTEA